MALIHKFDKLPQSILQQAGPPCRTILSVYKDVDLLNTFIVNVRETTELIAVPLTALKGKVVFVNTGHSKYVVTQPNRFERH